MTSRFAQLEPFLQQELALQYGGRTRSLPLAVVMLQIRMQHHVEVTPSLTLKFVHHVRSSSPTERDLLLQELRACPCMKAVVSAIERDAPPESRSTELPVPPAPPPHLGIFAFRPFSTSNVWARQQTFYRQGGLSCWSKGTVPHLISSNPFVAELYLTRMAEDLLARGLGRGGKRVKVVVADLGAGHCILSMLLVRHLRARPLAQRMRDLRADHGGPKKEEEEEEEDIIDVIVVAVDFHAQALTELAALPWVAELCQERRGSVEASAVLTFAAPGEASGGGDALRFVGAELEVTMPCACDMLVLVANYLLDSLPVDLVVTVPSPLGGHVVEIGVGASNGGVGGGGKKRSRGQQQQQQRDEVHLCRRVPLPPAAYNDDDDEVAFSRFAHAQLHSARGVRMLPRPVGCLSLLRQVDAAFPPSSTCSTPAATATTTTPGTDAQDRELCATTTTRPVFMLCGDFFMPSDDRSWLGQAAPTLCHQASEAVSVEMELDLPFISPTRECTALPVVPETLSWAFRRVFGGEGGGGGGGGGEMGSPRLPPLSGSKFSVLELRTGQTPSSSSVQPAFGPNELTVLQEVVSSFQYRRVEGGGARGASALDFFHHYLSLAHDVRQFLPSRWLILRHLRDAFAGCCESAALRLVSTWTELLLRCLGRGPESPYFDPDHDPGRAEVAPYLCPCLSFSQYQKLRLDSLQWLAALASALSTGRAASEACRAVVIAAMLRVLDSRAALSPPRPLLPRSFPIVLALSPGQRIEAQDPQELFLPLLVLLRGAGMEGGGDVARRLAVALRGHGSIQRGKRVVKIRIFISSS